MEIQHLEEFILLAQNRSFRQTAQQVGISPSALSLHMQSLETALGVRLLQRDSHSVSLTDEGRRFLSGARTVADNLRETMQHLNSMNDGTVRSLRIAMADTALPGLLGPYLDELVRRTPDLQLELLDDSRVGIAQGLAQDAVDLYLSFCARETLFPGTVRRRMFQAPLCALLPRQHSLAGQLQISMRQLDGERFILYPRTAESAAHDLQRHILELSGIHYSVYEPAASPAFYKMLVPIGKGVALVPWIQKDIVPNASAVLLRDVPCEYEMYAFYSKTNQNPLLPAVLEGYRRFEEAHRQ